MNIAQNSEQPRIIGLFLHEFSVIKGKLDKWKMYIFSRYGGNGSLSLLEKNVIEIKKDIVSVF